MIIQVRDSCFCLSRGFIWLYLCVNSLLTIRGRHWQMLPATLSQQTDLHLCGNGYRVNLVYFVPFHVGCLVLYGCIQIQNGFCTQKGCLYSWYLFSMGACSIRQLRWLDSPMGVVYEIYQHKNSRTDFIPAQRNLLNMKQEG